MKKEPKRCARCGDPTRIHKGSRDGKSPGTMCLRIACHCPAPKEEWKPFIAVTPKRRRK